MDKERIDFGEHLLQLRKSAGFFQKKTDNLYIDIRLPNKIEHGERQLQAHMIKPIAELFSLKFRELQIQFLNQKIQSEFGEEPFLIDALENYLIKNTTKARVR